MNKGKSTKTYTVSASNVACMTGHNPYEDKKDTMLSFLKRNEPEIYLKIKEFKDIDTRHWSQRAKEVTSSCTVPISEAIKSDERMKELQDEVNTKSELKIKEAEAKEVEVTKKANSARENLKKREDEASEIKELMLEKSKSIKDTSAKLEIAKNDRMKIEKIAEKDKTTESLKRLQEARKTEEEINNHSKKLKKEHEAFAENAQKIENNIIQAKKINEDFQRDKVEAEERTKRVVEEATNNLKAINSRIYTERGTKEEKRGIDEYEKKEKKSVSSRNSELLQMNLEFPNIILVIKGKIDGIEEGDCIIEHKRRQRRLFGMIPIYEKVQTHLYMKMKNFHKAKLVETFGDTVQTHSLIFNHLFWEEINSKIHNFLNHIQFVKDNIDQTQNTTDLETLLRSF